MAKLTTTINYKKTSSLMRFSNVTNVISTIAEKNCVNISVKKPLELCTVCSKNWWVCRVPRHLSASLENAKINTSINTHKKESD